MPPLHAKQCIPCQGGVPPVSPEKITELLAELNDWSVMGNHHLTRSWRFPDFAQALAFVNKIGATAEEQGHHPDIYLAWGLVRVETWTHKIDGLTESDFILAAKIDQLAEQR